MAGQQKGLEILCDVDSTVPERVLIDLDRVRQIIINLVGNAIKFTAKGEVELRVRVKFESESKAALLFSVRDTGIGIPSEKQAEIFEAFRQVDGSATRRYGGTGLGLAISTRLARLMEGQLWVESTPDVGSTFHFTVPCKLIETEPAETRCIDPELMHGIRVLVVDDNSSNRKIIERRLHECNADVQAAEGGEAALMLLSAAFESGKPYRVVLVDADLPDTGGFKLAAMAAEWGFTPLMMLSASNLQNGAARCRLSGIEHYVIKPIAGDELQKATRRALTGHGAAESPANGDLPVAITSVLRRRILLVEDNYVNRIVTQSILENQGHAVVVASNGIEAVARWEANELDLILMDVQMPEYGWSGSDTAHP